MLTALIGLSQVSYANPLPLGNTAGTNNLAVGEGSFASGTGSQAVGKNAIATGGNISPKAFKAELENFRDLVNQIEELRTQIAEQEKQGSVNQELQDTLKSQIAQYDTILERVREKQAQQAVLNEQKSAKQADLDSQTARLTELENSFGSNAFIPAGNKESYLNFLNIINALDWNKLKTPTGIADLTADLKNGVEKDFGKLDISDDKYQELIEGYRNAQGNLTFLKPIFDQKITDDFDLRKTEKDGFYAISNYTSYTSKSAISSSLTSNLYIKDAKPYTADQIANYILFSKPIEIEEKYSVPPPTAPRNVSSRSKEWIDYSKAESEWFIDNYKFRLKKGYRHKDLYKQIQYYIKNAVLNNLYADTNGALYKTAQNYKGYSSKSRRNLELNFIIAPVSKQLTETEFANPNDIGGMISHIRDISYNLDITKLQSLEKIVSSFNQYKNLIDYNNNDAWIFDKDEFRAYMDSTVLPFMGKMEELATNLRSLESSTLSEDERNAKAAKVIELRKYIKQASESDKKYYIHQFEPTKWNIDIKGEIVKAVELWKKYEAEAQSTLLPYKNNSLVITEIRKAIDTKAAEIKTQQETITTKQAEIADLQNQINALALTGEEQSAENVKNDLTVKLDEAKAALAKNQQTLKEKRDELLGLNNQLDNSPLGKKGKNALAEGTNAFASGENAIAFGTDSQATGNNAIALGADSKATADSAIAIGKAAQALKEKALALGENAIANGASAIAIGDNVGVSGEKAVGIGSNAIVSGNGAMSIGSDNLVLHKNAVVIGSNITQTAENSVNLGNESATTVKLTPETAGTTQYAHSEILGEIYKFAASEPAGVVTVGAKGKERRIQNVAAGLVSETSTDAVNGSQLYAVAKAADEGKIGTVKYKTTETATGTKGTVEIATHLGGDEVNIQNSSGTARRLTGVSEGLAPTDAVNKQQLDSGLDTLTKAANEGKIGAVKYKTTETATGTKGVVEIATHLGGDEVNIQNNSGTARRLTGVSEGLAPTDAINKQQLDSGLDTLTTAANEGKIGVVRYTTTGVVGIANHLDGNEVNISNKSGNTRLLTGLSEGLAPTDAVNKAQLDREIGVVNNKISGVENKVGNVVSRVGDVVNRVGNVENRVGNVENKVGNVVNRVGNVENRVGGVENRVGNVENRVGNVENKVGNVVNRVGGVENRVGGVENRVGGVENRVGDVENRVGNVVNRVGGVENRVGGVENRVGNVENRVGNVENRVGNVEKEVKNVKGSVSNAIAIASLPQVSVPGKRQLSVATGHTLGTTAVAVGLNGLSDNGRISYKLGTSVSQNSNFAVGAGIGFSW
ncbi:YadA-like family protein [Mannheimia pernigra]|uniref:YadA-like family protein n=1 Tax=Mannheimia pernigra TaxID=111844 RepID=UPI001F2FDA11|nr:YadA-like family protein [Mannheimia pernigra]